MGTPVVRVRARSQRRFSVTVLACYKPGERSRLVDRPKRHTDHKRGGRAGAPILEDDGGGVGAVVLAGVLRADGRAGGRYRYGALLQQ